MRKEIKCVLYVVNLAMTALAAEPACPACSRYHYEEMLLERVLRNELALEQTLKDIKETNTKVVDALRKSQHENDKVNTAIELMERKQISMEAKLDDTSKTALANVSKSLSHILTESERVMKDMENTVQRFKVHGDWTLWSTWSDCSATCDVGLRERTRTCTNPKPSRCGDYCVGDPSEYAVCSTNPCTPRSYPVGFSVHGVNILANHVNAFPIIIFNTDKVYNPMTGHFTAPVDGIYAFASQVCVQTDSQAWFFIEKGNDSMTNKTRLTASIAQPRHGSCYSVSTYAQLTRNEHVWLLLDLSSTSRNILESGESYWTALTGTLIQRQ